MFKRFLVVFLSLSLILVPCLAVQVYAADSTVIDLLQYSSANNSGSNSFLYQTGDIVVYELPYNMPVYYIDMIVDIPYSGVSEAFIAHGGDLNDLQPLTIEYISGYTYRIYGDYGSAVSSLYLYFVCTWGSQHINMLKLDVYSTTFDSVNVIGSISLKDAYGTTFVTMSSPDTSAVANMQYQNFLGPFIQSFSSQIFVSDWHKYDRLYMILDIACTSIDSITATIGDVSLPVDVSYLEFTNGAYVVVREMSSVPAETVPMIRTGRVIIDIDISGIKRGSLSQLTVDLDGTYCNTRSDQFIKLTRVVGNLDITYVDPIIFNLREVYVGLSDWFNTLFSDLSTGLTALGNNIYDDFVDLTSSLSTFFTNLTNDISVMISTLSGSIKGWFSDLNNRLDSLFNGLINNLAYWFGTQFEKLDQLIDPDSPETDQAIQDANDSIGEIKDFEDQYAADLDSELVSSEVDKVQNYGNALVFCSSILSRSFNNLGGYQIIYILPVCIGIFLFVCSRVRVPSVPSSKHNESVSADALRQSHSLGKPSHSSMYNDVS